MSAAVVHLGDEADLGRELRITPPWIELLFPVIRRAVGALVGGEREGDDFIDADADAGNGAVEAGDETTPGRSLRSLPDAGLFELRGAAGRRPALLPQLWLTRRRAEGHLSRTPYHACR